MSHANIDFSFFFLSLPNATQLFIHGKPDFYMCPCTWLNRLEDILCHGHHLNVRYNMAFNRFLCRISEKWVSELPYLVLNRIYLRDYSFKRCIQTMHIKSINANIKCLKIDSIDLWKAFFNQPNDSFSRKKYNCNNLRPSKWNGVCLHGQAHSLSSSLTVSFVISTYDK